MVFVSFPELVLHGQRFRRHCWTASYGVAVDFVHYTHCTYCVSVVGGMNVWAGGWVANQVGFLILYGIEVPESQSYT